MAETYNDINLKSLVFNKVTNEEYRQMVQNGTIKDDEFYITPSELIDVPNIDSTTSGKYLTNDGTGALWSDVKSTNIVQDLSNPSADTVLSSQAVADESSRIMSIMNNKVSKSGDTMTGQLTVKDASIILSSTKDVLNAFRKTDEDDTQTPTKNHIDAFRVVDKNNKIMSDFRSQRHSTGNLTQMLARKNNADGTIKQADISCIVDANGNPSSTLNQTTYVNGAVVSNLDNVNFIARSKSLVKGTTPTDSNKYVGYDWQDKRGQRLAYLGVSYKTNGSKRLELQKLDNNLSEFNINYAIRNPYNFYFQDTQHTLGNVDVNTWSDNQIQFQDSKGTRLACVQPLLAPDGTARLCLAASKGKESESSLVIGSDGYTQCPKPADNSNTYAIATTNWAGGLNRENTWTSTNIFKNKLNVQGNASFSGEVTFNSKTKDTEFYSNANFYEMPKIRINGNARYKSVCTGYTKGTAPTTYQFGGISTTDKNGVEVATLYSAVDPNNSVTSALLVKQPTAAGTEAKALSIWCDKNGVFHTTCSVPSAEPNSILTTVSHGQGYAKLGNGIIIQSGIFTASASTKTGQVTLPLAMTTSNYRVLFTQNTAGNASYKGTAEIRTTTHGTTYFKWAAVNCSSDFNMFIDWFLIVLPK